VAHSGQIRTQVWFWNAKGNIYGDTDWGGASSLGTVYKLNKKGLLKLLHSFVESHGDNPYGGVLRDGAGNLYGTTTLGGITQSCHSGCGTVWKLTP